MHAAKNMNLPQMTKWGLGKPTMMNLRRKKTDFEADANPATEKRKTQREAG